MTSNPLAEIALLAVSVALLWFGAEWVVTIERWCKQTLQPYTTAGKALVLLFSLEC